MYRINQNRTMAFGQKCGFDARNHMLSRRNACSTFNSSEGKDDCLEHNENSNCGTYQVSEFNYSLAMVYSPEQIWQNLYTEEEGFVAGTIFKELDKPFYGQKCHGGACNE